MGCIPHPRSEAQREQTYDPALVSRDNIISIYIIEFFEAVDMSDYIFSFISVGTSARHD